MQQYDKTDTIHRFIDAEKQRLETAFAQHQLMVKQSPLYAARIREYSDFLTYTGNRLNLDETEMQAERNGFIAQRLDLQQLYHSGFWKEVIESYLASLAADDSLLVSGSRTLLSRAAGNREMEEALLRQMTLQFHKLGKENRLADLGIAGLVSPGRLAPMLRLANKHIRPVNSLVVFYESGCGSCENEVRQLVGNYPVLKERGMEVISVAADMDGETFKANAALFPWQDKYCDYEGFSGENFRNYEIMGTPTYILTDGEGVIKGRFARLEEVFQLGITN